MTIDRISVYRFHDTIALDIDGMGGTVYLSHTMAIDLANTLNEGFADIMENRFTQSTLPEVTIFGGKE